ncbi:unnamed protein product [Toxocara canis]|uniref:Zinc finger protein n=1 Tax=Toxocara canis TaxID=6265 RepID=A0A183UPV2_TOXCA|nr:unnamed protein product [Toxocara canis]
MLSAEQQLIEHMIPEEPKPTQPAGVTDRLQDVKVIKQANAVSSPKMEVARCVNPPSLMITAKSVDGDGETQVETVQETALDTAMPMPLSLPGKTPIDEGRANKTKYEKLLLSLEKEESRPKNDEGVSPCFFFGSIIDLEV